MGYATHKGAVPLHTYFLSQADSLLTRAKAAGLPSPVIQSYLFELGTQQDKLNAIRAEFDEHGFGLILRAPRSWAILLQDPSEAGRFRYQVFDEKGFSGHVTRSHMDEVILEAFRAGFCEIEEDQTILEKLVQSERWKRGMLAAHLTQQVNAGLITYVDAHALFEQQCAELTNP